MNRMLLALALCLMALPAGAHITATGLARIALEGEVVRERLTLVLGELSPAAGQPIARAAEGDQASAEAVGEMFKRLLTVRAEGKECRPGRLAISGSRLGDTRVEIDLAFRCPDRPRRLGLRNNLVEIFGEHYRTITIIETGDGNRETFFDNEQREVDIDLGAPRVSGWRGFIRLGIQHITGGIDHLLFLLALVIGSGRMLAQMSIVTGFTVAHSVTLSLAALGIANLPRGLVEPLIAASIAWMALENLLAKGARGHRWLVTFLFGLVHGFGFASGLLELGIPRDSLVAALVGFNIGVEAGQAATIVILLPLLAWIQRQRWGQRIADRLSFTLAGIGVIWMVVRVVDGVG